MVGLIKSDISISVIILNLNYPIKISPDARPLTGAGAGKCLPEPAIRHDTSLYGGGHGTV